MMKILYYLPSLYAPGGLERIVTFKANYFSAHFQKCEVILLTSEQVGKPSFYPISSKVKHIDLDVPFDYPFGQSKLTKLLKYPFRYYRFKQRFNRVLREESPDITISTLRREVYFLSSLRDGSTKVGEFHVTRHAYQAEGIRGDWFFQKWLKKKWNNYFVSRLKKLSRIVVLTAQEKTYWPELHNLEVIANPLVIEPSAYSLCSSKQVIAVGRYMPQKGFDLLIDAWKHVQAKHPDWVLRIYGDGMREQLQTQVDALGLAASCFLEHTVSNIVDKYCESSVFVLSSRYEGFGMVLVEAMACGVPPVSFACPCGPRDIIRDGEDGILVENGNVEALADRICYLIEHEEVRKEMGAKARINSRRFLIEQIARQWKELFEDVIHDKKLDL